MFDANDSTFRPLLTSQSSRKLSHCLDKQLGDVSEMRILCLPQLTRTMVADKKTQARQAHKLCYYINILWLEKDEERQVVTALYHICINRRHNPSRIFLFQQMFRTAISSWKELLQRITQIYFIACKNFFFNTCGGIPLKCAFNDSNQPCSVCFCLM